MGKVPHLMLRKNLCYAILCEKLCAVKTKSKQDSLGKQLIYACAGQQLMLATSFFCRCGTRNMFLCAINAIFYEDGEEHTTDDKEIVHALHQKKREILSAICLRLSRPHTC